MLYLPLFPKLIELRLFMIGFRLVWKGKVQVGTVHGTITVLYSYCTVTVRVLRTRTCVRV